MYHGWGCDSTHEPHTCAYAARSVSVLKLDASQGQSAATLVAALDEHHSHLLLSVHDAELVVVGASELAEEVGGVEHDVVVRTCATRVRAFGHLDTVPAPQNVRAPLGKLVVQLRLSCHVVDHEALLVGDVHEVAGAGAARGAACKVTVLGLDAGSTAECLSRA